MKEITTKSKEFLEIESKLRKLLDNSYCAYSNFRVSSIVVMKDGKAFVGVNVENAAYGSAICAERSAILAAISNGYKKGDFKAIYCMDSGSSEKISSSCGACLQVMSEFFERDIICTFININGKAAEFTFGEMLPHAFTIEDLIGTKK